jgi:hypothetical protein
LPAPEPEDRFLIVGKRPQGFRVIKSFLAAAEQKQIEDWILANFAWWERRQGMLPPAAQYPQDDAIPAWAGVLGERMAAAGFFPSPPDHVLLRRYGCGQGVHPHIDRPEYGPIVAGLTLASSRVFTLTPPRGRSRLDALLLPGDLYVMTGAARRRWRHSIPARSIDEFGGAAIPRANGFSVTWRYQPGSHRQPGWRARVQRLSAELQATARRCFP